MSMQEFKYNVFGNIRPSKVKTTISDDVDNPYLGKFMVRFCDGETAICSYKFPTDDDIENDDWVPLWVKDSTGEEIEATDGDLWYPMDYIFCMLSGFPTPYSCWEFGCALAQFAIPALDVWIRKGVSYHPCMTPEEWHDVLRKIKRAFEVSLADMSGETEDDDKALLEEHDRIRKEGFALLAEHYLHMWD